MTGRSFKEALERDDRLLAGYVELADEAIARVEARVKERISREAPRAEGSVSTIAIRRIFRIAAAALVIAAALSVGGVSRGSVWGR